LICIVYISLVGDFDEAAGVVVFELGDPVGFSEEGCFFSGDGFAGAWGVDVLLGFDLHCLYLPGW
jgi:hypothetical protein